MGTVSPLRHLYGPQKGDSILNWPVPTCAKDIQSFLGLANFYRRYIPGFANLAYPLHLLLRKNVKFSWSPDTKLLLTLLNKNLPHHRFLFIPTEN